MAAPDAARHCQGDSLVDPTRRDEMSATEAREKTKKAAVGSTYRAAVVHDFRAPLSIESVP